MADQPFGPDVPILCGVRVVLRPPGAGDLEARAALGQNAHVAEMFGVSLETDQTISKADAAAWLERLARHPHAWVIERRKLIGEIRLDGVDLRDRRASLAVAIYDPAQLGLGLGTEAMELVLGHAFRTLRLHRVGVRVLAFNARAIRAYRKCGFQIEGRERETAFVKGAWHDDLIMGLLAEEFGRLYPTAPSAQQGR